MPAHLFKLGLWQNASSLLYMFIEDFSKLITRPVFRFSW